MSFQKLSLGILIQAGPLREALGSVNECFLPGPVHPPKETEWVEPLDVEEDSLLPLLDVAVYSPDNLVQSEPAGIKGSVLPGASIWLYFDGAIFNSSSCAGPGHKIFAANILLLHFWW